jgi:hypothetical protein
VMCMLISWTELFYSKSALHIAPHKYTQLWKLNFSNTIYGAALKVESEWKGELIK